MGINFYEQSFFRRCLYLLVTCFLFSYSAVQAQQYDLSLAKSVDLDSVGIGDQVVFTAILSNDGDAVSNVNVAFQPFPGTTFIGATGDGAYASGVWNVPTLAAGAMAMLDITWQIDTVGVFYCAGEIASFSDAGGGSVPDSDSTPGNGALSEDDIASSCTSVPIELCPSIGETVTLTAPNGYPSYTWFRVYDEGSNGTIDTVSVADAQEVIVGDFGKYFYTAQDASGCGLGSCCPVIIDNKCFDLALTKLTTASSVTLGDVVLFTINVANQGDIDAQNVEIIDYIPLGMSYDPAQNTGLGWTVSGSNVVTTIPTLGIGATATLTINLTVTDLSLSLTNASEITAAEDGNGNPATDEDSTPDTSNGDQLIDREGANDHVDIDFEADDEDDHDVATVMPATFDLALSKLTTATNVTIGDKVPFTINVANQGTVDATNIGITDYVPTGFTYYTADNTGWTGANGTTAGMVTTTIPALAAGAATSVTIVLEVTDVTASLTNTAEISAALNGNGQPVMDEDSSPDNINGDPVVDQTGPNDHVTIDNAPDDEDDHDIATVTPGTFDLALTKLTMVSGVTLGDKVPFTINVANQGTIDATNIQVADYVPSGMTYYTADNTGWTGADGTSAGTVTTTIATLAAGAATSVTIILEVTDLTADLVNASEISAALNGNGQPVMDEDSTPDSVNGDPVIDREGTNDHVTIDEEANDEDDHDIAEVRPAGFDLALNKLVTSTGPFTAGDKVTFTIQVGNQGVVDAENVDVIDYIPAGFTFFSADNPDWTGINAAPGGTATTTIANLDVGMEASVDIILTINDDAGAVPGNLTNAAEIFEAENDNGEIPMDEDSDPDMVNGDMVDDQTGNEHLTVDNAPDDEDDHDIATIELAEFDLALSKLTPVSTVTLGEKITFTINVANQGMVDAQNIEVVDYIPAGFTFLAADNAGWTGTDGDNEVTIIIADLDAGNATSVDIVLTATDLTASLTNAAEISEAENNNGNNPVDEDSSPDDTNGDPVVDQTGPTDHIDIDFEADDEDDHDIAVVEPAIFDLSLSKLTSASVVTLGDLVPFTINVANQGDVDAQNITITDYIPTGFTYFAADNTGWTGANGTTNGQITTTIPNLDAGASTFVTINLVVSDLMANLENAAEISSAENDFGEMPADEDSTPDSVNGDPVVDQTGLTDHIDIDNGPDDEDDHDVAEVAPAGFDLALNKIVSGDMVTFGDKVTFTIQVGNQGIVDAQNVEVIDYIPSGFTFFAADNPTWVGMDGVAGGTATTTLANLDAGQGQSVNIILTVNDTAGSTPGDLTNAAEISYSENDNGETPLDEDSTSDTVNGDQVDDQFGNEHLTVDNAPDDEDDHDIASVELAEFDLALIKLTNAANVTLGDVILFTIQVKNQGDVDAQNIDVIDYIPTGLAFPPMDIRNVAWSVITPSTVEAQIADLDAGEETTLDIWLEVISEDPAEWVNASEITAAENDNGEEPIDSDSTPDDVNADEVIDRENPTDNDTFDDEPNDEDDHDIAIPSTGTFDLALIKLTTTTVAQIGDDVPFEVKVANQGTIDAQNISIVDYIPSGFDYDPANNTGSNWTVSGTDVMHVIADLDAGTDTILNIVLTVNNTVTASDDNIINTAEITEAFNDAGGQPEDEDSVPDNDNGDPLVDRTDRDDHINIDDAQDDEDDHDIALVPIDIVDLAINKVNDSMNAIQGGDDVTWTVTVYNQGNVTMQNIQIIDYLPDFFILSPADTYGWTAGPTTTSVVNTVAGPLEPGEFATVKIVTRADLLIPSGGYQNTVEIYASEDEGGNDRTDDDIDSTADQTQGNDNQVNDEIFGDAIDEPSEDEDDEDPAFVNVNVFDLALRKTTDQTEPVQWGEDVTFTVTVFNQGSITATDIDVIDYIPDGFILSPNDFNGWNFYGGSSSLITNTFGDILTSGDSLKVDVVLQVVPGAQLNVLENNAEITHAEDENGNVQDGEDIDSTPDDMNGNDNEVDDMITDNGDTDEDDHDPQEPPVFDLALRKTVDDDVVARIGDDVDYRITIFNQGNMTAANVEITDYLPTGFVLSPNDMNGWTSDGVTATTTLAGPLVRDDSMFVDITLRVTNLAHTDDLINYAEISAAQDDMGNDRTDDDIDSTTDSDNTNDILDDNVITENPIIDGTDEDDHDMAIITIYDLAIRKTPILPDTVTWLDDVMFTFTIFNQSIGIDAQNINVIDYIPAGFILSPNDNNGWVASADGTTASNTVAGPVAVGDSVAVNIVLQVERNTPAGLHYNNGEITGSEDTDGNDMTGMDYDSNDDDTFGNDTQIDNDIDGHAINDPADSPNDSEDEDDEDVAPVFVEIFDLALRKTTNQEGPVLWGDDVTFFVTVFNQGSVDAYDVRVIDHLPPGFFLSQSDTNSWVPFGSVMTNVIPGPIAVGDSAVLEMVLTVQEGASAYSFDNLAEIFAAEDIDGDDRTDDDVDSTPDTNPNNDNLEDDVVDGDVVGNPNEDEDDHDIAFVDIYDLALRKTTPQITPVQPYDDVLFVIEVFNQGSITAANIDLVDYIPAGFMLSPNETNWTASADGMSATQTLAGPLAPQDTALLTILLQVTPGVADVIGNTSTVLYNDAEITRSEDDMGNDMSAFDVDSTPDDENGNDLVINDEINDGGDRDEDDHDIAGVMVEIVDLALRKTTTITNPIQVGDDVVFAIEIFNQGTIPAVNIEVTDHLPAGVILSPADGNGWAANTAGTILTNTIAGPIPPGNSLSIGVVVQVTADASSADITNLAEITYHEDPFGEDRTDQDYDSTADDDPNNDVSIDNEINEDTVANPGTDEDDHDGENLYIFDLALEKTTNQIDPVRPGDDVIFFIEVFNQGSITATNVDVIDYIPTGFMLSPADTNGWIASADGTTATNTIANPLAGGTSSTIEIVLQVMPQPMDGTFNNIAEITGAEDINGNEIGDQDWDSTPDDIVDNDPEIDGEIFDNGTNDEDDQDPASVTIDIVDIALTKVIDPATQMPVEIGDEVIFNITVTNQGSIDLYNIDLVDYIPTGYALSASDANGWIPGPNNTATVTYAGPILGNTSITLGIVVDVLPTAPVGISYNFAEVVSIEDDMGNDITNEDIDSDGDDNPDNDGPWTDNETDNANDDEDDHDGAHVVLNGFDLALRKTLSAGQAAAVVPGDDVTFTITVFNQGQQNAFSVDIVDYIPTGLALNDADWGTDGTNATYTINSVASGDSVAVDITFTVDPDFAETAIINFAEIASATDPLGNPGDDVDSTPDNDDTNDNFDPADDDDINQDANSGGDEDDHDSAEIEITQPIFDVALTKVLADGQSPIVKPGDDVTYTVTVYNQGDTDIFDVVVIDYVPVEMSLNDGNWIPQVSDAAREIDFIAAGDSVMIDITLQVNTTFAGTELINFAEIMQFSDEDFGTPIADVDSTPDNDPSNDTGGTPDSDEDNHINDDGMDTDGDGIEDEDDHDPASIQVEQPFFDLALTKVLADGQRDTVTAGDEVTYTITVYNQANTDAYDVAIVDYVPVQMSLSDGDWTYDGTNATYTVDYIAAGDSVLVDVTLMINPTFTGNTLVNYAEIMSGSQTDGGPNAVDVDSTPDDDDSNDIGGMPDSNEDNHVSDDGMDSDGDGITDEDDHDPESIAVVPSVTDLALTKTLAADQAIGADPGEDVTFTVTVFNQGTEDAYNVEIVDYIPTGLILNDADWTTDGTNALFTLAAPLAWGDQVSVDVTFTIDPNHPAGTSIINYAEIASFEDENGDSATDVDSTPDSDSTNDVGGTPDTDEDDNTSDDGMDTDGDGTTDEDDHDPAVIEVGQMFDLALVKTLPAGAPMPVAPGDDITFEIVVTNQGNIDAYDIDIVDYIPANLILNDADWTASAGNATYTLDFLEAYATTSVMITFTVDPTFTGSSIINFAEITDATDEDGGDTREDDDSTSDDDPTNDVTPEDDEDDYDPEAIVIEQQGFDLALTKTLADGQAPTVNPGDDVTFTVTVFNQGNVDAYDVDIVDYVPVSMSLNDSNWYAVSSNAGYTVDFLAAGDSIAIDITLNVNATFTGNMATNFAEIADASETDGGPTTPDLDSTPDDDNENDGYTDGSDNEIHEDGFNGGDEDDHDPETVVVIPYEYDLALRKIISEDQMMPVSPGDDVTFTITVFNQGARPTTNIEITDYIPEGLTLSDADWTLAGDNATTTLAGPLAVADSMAIDITFTIDLDFLGNTIVNGAEISDFADEDGNPALDEDSVPNDDILDDTLIDNEIGDDGTMDEDDHDIAVLPVEHIFDLALTKTLTEGQANPVLPGDNVTFTITVINQGTTIAQNIDLIDYVPAGMTLDTSSVVNSAAGWVQEITCLGDPVVCDEVSFGGLAGPIAAGESMTVNVEYTITGLYTEDTDLTNFAEITGAEDNEGNTPVDIDSTPDTDEDNDTYTTNDEVEGDGNNNGDEDDHDPETITVNPIYFDLALNKVLADGQTTALEPGDDVTFTINVFNQGTQDAYNVDVVDYIPTGLTLNDADWTMDGANATTTLAGPLVAGADMSVDITFTIDTDFMGDAIVNKAEIADFEDVNGDHPNDGDSTPDNDPDNDPLVDDEINDNGTTDEDDNDIAMIDLTQTFDLALLKTLAAGQDATVNPGDDVTFTITVFNQGTLDAYNVDIIDYVPANMSLNDGNWTVTGTTATSTVAFVPAGGSTPVNITLMVNETFSGSSITNFAEITDAEDVDGDHPMDEDSTPDDNPDNDPVVDGETNDNGTTDEDDHDLETINVEQLGFDLALVKTLAAGQSSMVTAGEDVTFTITVINQGNADAYNVEVTDYIPADMTLNDADWGTLSGNAIYQLDFLEVGASISIDITLTVSETFTQGSITNVAEISDFEDENGDDPQDVDSTPDSDPINDLVVNDETNDDGTNDEDDHDTEIIDVFTPVYDLALAKDIATDQDMPVAPGDTVTYTITVFNQGTDAVYNVNIIDYIPTGLTLADADWTDNSTTATTSIAGPILANNAASVDITFVIDANFMGTSLENVAEISDFEDEDGNNLDDEDSTPDDNPSNDPDDEDDADLEVIDVEQIFDLALIKTLAADQATSVAPGEDVTFTITVINQGTLDAYNVEIVDYIPAAMSLNDSDWGTQFSYATTTVAFVPAGGSVAVDITLMVNETFSGSNIVNFAEITDADNDDDPTNDDPVDEDSTPDDDPSNDPVVDDETDDNPDDEDDHDLEDIDVTQPGFDLALIKSLATDQASTVTPDDDVTFTITVFNQGEIDAYDVDVIDYIPTGMSLNDGNWTIDGANAITTIDFVEAGTSVSVDITFTIDTDFAGNSITNIAEITEATDEPNGDPIDDEDSTPDSDPTNDPTVDDEINDDGTEDEDDSDPAVINILPEIFDLALNKTLAATQAPTVAPGEDVTFTITVFNQGTADAYGVEVIDHVPAGLALNDADWTLIGGDALFTVPVITAGNQVAIDVTFTVSPDFMGTAITNVAEITDGSDEPGGNTADDIDSTPDNDPTNDPTIDDEINDDGTNDEDDNDPEVITIEQTFDLALTKSLAADQAATVEVGDDVTFTITVTNQGTIDAYDVDVVDYVPTGLVLNDPNWMGTANGAETTIDFVAAGQSADVNIILMVSPDFIGTSIENTAEITEATDESGGDPVEDEDSTPDTDSTNDDPTDDNDNNDEDDHDDEVITVENNDVFDLAVKKKLSHLQPTPIELGDEVTYTIFVFNEGNVDAYDVDVIDYIPAGLTLNDADWTLDGGNAVTTLSFVEAGTSVGIDITFTIDSDFQGTSITNVAEITEATDEPGGDPVDDVDSTPDNDPSDDDPSDDNPDNDEDDSDEETIEFNVCDDVVASADVAICQGESAQLTATTTETGVTYAWTPALGLSCVNCPNPVASPNQTVNYQVTATSDGCESTDLVTVTVNPSIFVDATSTDADCCELGAIELVATGGTGDFTYTWSPNVSDTNTATDLEEGTYTITVTDVAGCSVVVTETLENNCADCPEYITEEVITINLGDEVGICTTIPFLDRDIYGVILDGSTYTPPMVVCDVDTVIFYTYALTVNQGQSGPYEVDSWVCANGIVHSAVVQDMAELAELMQEWDPTGNWMDNPETFTISGGNTSSGYENLEITHIPTGVHATIMTNFTGIARGTDITYIGDEPGTHILEVEGPNCCQDEVTIIVVDPCADYEASAGADVSICEGASTTLNATGGTSYKWSPATGLSTENGATPIASPATTTTYSVTVTSAEGCEDVDEVTVEVLPAVRLDVTSTENADCCTGGSATLTAVGGTGNYTYAWSHGGNTVTATNLEAGNYTATVTDANGCSATAAFTIEDECTGCPDLFEDDVVTVPAGSTYEVCVPALLQDANIYDVILDGSTYEGPMNPCDIDSVVFYTYALVINQGNSGPYRLDSWTCNDVTVENIVVNDMAELTAIMNANDPTGNWVHNPSTFTISGGADGNENVYGNILITHIPTQVQATIMTNFTGIAAGTELSVTGDPGEHELIIVNTAECCYDTLTVIFEVVCDLNVSADVTDGDCCGENGAITFNVTGGDGNYTYTWENGTTAANTATGLSAGSYKVTITDGNGCTQVGQVNIGSDCSACEDVFDEDTITFTEGQDAGVCVGVPFVDRNIYDVILDGSDYTQPITPCDVDSVIFYTYALVVNQGNSGPYNLDLWQCNDIVLQDIVVQDMAELVSVMNANDPTGNWVLNPSTFTISGGEDDNENVYGDILITHIETSVQATIQTNITGVAFGFFIDTPDTPGEYEVEVYNNETCCSDIITVIVEEEDDVVTPPYTATIELTTPFGTPINNVCVPVGDAFAGDITSMSICGQPSNGALSNIADGDACVDYTPATGFFGQDQFCIEVCNANGECGIFTVVITVEQPITPPTPGNDTIFFATPYETPLGTQCMPTNKYFAGPLASISLCGTPSNGTVTDLADGDACINYVPNDGFSGTDEFCIEVCNADGVCGTFTIFVTVGEEEGESYEETIFLTTPFATTLTNICLPWTNAFPSGLETVMIGDMPDNGTLGNVADGDACVDYTPATGFFGTDEFVIVVCDEQGTCGTFTVVITVGEPITPPNPGIDSIYYTTAFETPLTGICMPFDKFFNDELASISVCDAPANGTIANIADEDACIDYVPNDGFSGTDEFCIEVCNAEGICGTLIIFVNVGENGGTTITVTNATITLTTTEETPIDICLDPSELEGNPTQIETCEAPSNGILTPVNGNAVCITYTPAADFIGSDDFCLILCDDANVCDTTFVTIITNDATTDTCTVVAPAISTMSNTTVCADDGVADLVEVSIDGGSYENNAWLVTDPDGNVLALPTSTPIDFEGSGAGLCLIWNVAYNGDLGGLEVGVNANDFEGCYALSNAIAVTRNTGDDCDGMIPCDDIIDSTPITVTTCTEGLADVCLPISLEDIAVLTVTDNGAAYTAGFTGCDLDTSLVYLYVTLPGEGNSGPYTLLSWTENGELHENIVFNTMENLLTLINMWDPEGNWMLNEQTMTISGGQSGGTYSAMLIKQDATNTTTLIDYNDEVTANGTQVSLADGVHTLVFTDAEGCTDMVEVTVDCGDVVSPSDCDNLIEDDETIALQTADCDAPVDVCFDLAFDKVDDVEMYINNLQYTETPTSCDGGFGTAIGLLPGDYEVEFVDTTNGCRDTVDVMIACITSMTVTDTIYVNATDTTCIDISELPGTITSIQNVCPENSGELVVFELQPETYCVTYDGMEVGNESACVVVCDDYGFCDTTYVFVTIEEREAIPSVVADVDTTLENTPIDIFVLNNDTLGTVTSVEITTQPENGTATITAEGVATYTPNAGYCGGSGDVFTYTVCDDQGNCASAPVTVYVLCSEMQVYTGFSPNGDGINDNFFISGLEAFPDARLSVFNRWGTQVYKSDNYKNDWDGTWNGGLLPDGTYFYVLDDGKGQVYSGYIQIQR